jgi:hypothetical protein
MLVVRLGNLLAQVAEPDQRSRGIMTTREVMGLAPLGHEAAV